MTPLRTHLTDLEAAASNYASCAAFKVPDLDPSTGRVREWVSINYEQFKKDVELFAKYWAHVLKAQGIPPRSVVGIWCVDLLAIKVLSSTELCNYRIGGTTYIDVLQIYGVSRAGYIPQLFSLRLSSAEVIFELLQKANAKALIYDSSHLPALSESSPVATYLAINVKDESATYEHLPDMPEVVDGGETAFIFHTSGSTSGSPKLVPWTYSFILFLHHKVLQVIEFPKPWRQRIFNWTGSVCHSAQSMGMHIIPVPQQSSDV
jgi:acyl-CoA synthetase (AMP-forming)/AMP-acid ligase II